MKTKIIVYLNKKGIKTAYSGKLKTMFFFVKSNYEKLYNEMYADEESGTDSLNFKLIGIITNK